MLTQPSANNDSNPGPLAFLTRPPARGKLGWVKALCAVFGGLATAYSGMTFLTCLIPAQVGEAILVPFLFTPFAWSLSGLWISLSPTRRSAILRSALPSMVFSAGIIYFQLQG